MTSTTEGVGPLVLVLGVAGEAVVGLWRGGTKAGAGASEATKRMMDRERIMVVRVVGACSE